jgi:hypothetical protein
MINNNYTIVPPDTPTHYPDQHNHQPDVLDIAILKNINLQYELRNCTDELSSDHSPVIITLRGKLSANPPTTPRTVTNWPKFAVDLHCDIPSPKPIINSEAELNQEVEKLTSTIQNALSNNTSNVNNLPNCQIIPDSIQQESIKNRKLRRA